jgi:putative autotransporter adhesin-like protein
MSLVFSTGAFAFGTVRGSGNTATINKEFSAIDELTLKGISDFTIVKSDTTMISITGDQTFIDMVNLQDKDGYLYIESNVKYPVSVVVSTPSLESLILSKGSKGALEGEFNMDSLSISLTNKSSLTVADALTASEISVYAGVNTELTGEVYTKLLTVDSLGTSKVALSGEAEQFKADFTQGAGVFNNLNVQYADINVRGESTVDAVFPGNSITTVTASSDSAVSLDMNGILKVNMSGDSTLEYAGNIEWVGRIVSGDAEVSSL